ncbi:MAG: N-acetylmuramoyl-L-alanine amidase [Oscillospiraceae bacterium]|nr:N-acetylmuramoyl-L-alanine amidase [Oscillospiraceae bacterium]
MGESLKQELLGWRLRRQAGQLDEFDEPFVARKGMVIKMNKTLSIILTVIFVAQCLIPSIFAEQADFDVENAVGDSEELSTFTTTAEHERRFYLPGNMRGVILRPAVEKPLTDNMFDEIAALGMNTVIIATTDRDSIFYNTDMNKSDEQDLLSKAIESATSRGLNVYLTFDINTVLCNGSRSSHNSGSINSLIAELHKFALKYYCDGIILDNYYSSRTEESFARYMEFGAGMGYDNWLYDSTENFFKTAADTIRLTDNSIPVGIMLNDFSGSTNPPSGGKSGGTAGFADTLAFLESDYADFVMLNAPDAYIGAEEGEVEIPFGAITDYWGEVCASSEIPMYIIHHNQRIGEESRGWRGDDQLLRQLSAAKKTPAYKGSVFNSFPDLMENRLNSTETMRLFFDDQINEETLFEELVINSPKSQSFSTSDSFAIFQGTHDDNFDVFLNDVEIELNEAGNFYIEEPLEIGMNRFTLKHKGKTVTYTIERRVIPLHAINDSIGNGITLEVEGGTVVTVDAVAYRGASVNATVNGYTFRLTQQDYNLDDPALNSSYAPFSGSYQVPDGIIGQAQELGIITVTASLSGFSRSIQGATLRVIPLPEPPYIPPVDVEWFDQDSVGSGEVVGRMNPIRSSSEPVNYVRILNNNTDVHPVNTTGTARNPDFSRLPAGTLDYHQSTVGGFYTTMNGKRISAENAVVESGFGMGENNLVVLSGGTTGRNSFLRIALEHRSSFNVMAAGLSYSTAFGGDFNVNDFNASFIYVDFDNVTSVTKLPSFEHNHVFSAGKWETVTIDGIPKFRLVLELRRKGVYAGSFARYNQDGELMLTFRALTSSLVGMNIVIDPGHGVTANGFDPGAIGHIHEFDANIAVARKLRDRLRALGANAQMLPTNETFYTTRNRPDYARDLYDCDLLISLHCNAVAGSTAKGTEVWYFTPFSQPLASSISSSVAAYFQNNVYPDAVTRNRGAKYSYYLMTLAQDYPSVLVEMGFVTNIEDAMALASEHHQTGIANSIATGIQNYLDRSNT